MCHFITLVSPSADKGAVSAVMVSHGRAARTIDNPFISRALAAGEHQYLTTPGHCDCGTALVPEATPEQLEVKLAKEAAKWAAKGWSATKIARAVEDRRKAAVRAEKHRPDSLDLWEEIIGTLLGTLKMSHVGLLVHYYSSGLEDESLQVTRRDAQGTVMVGLQSIRPGEILIFRRG